jgi:hypothetical protein
MIAPECNFLPMDAAELAFDSDSFDNILCIESAYHFATRTASFQTSASDTQGRWQNGHLGSGVPTSGKEHPELDTERKLSAKPGGIRAESSGCRVSLCAN